LCLRSSLIPMSLAAAANALTKVQGFAKGRADVVRLYRDVQHHLPRILTIFDITSPKLPEARLRVRELFDKNRDVQDTRVVSLLVSRGQQELEETLMQWKQKSQLMRTLAPAETQDRTNLARALHMGGGADADREALFMANFRAGEDHPDDGY
jgi:hypothetical protein